MKSSLENQLFGFPTSYQGQRIAIPIRRVSPQSFHQQDLSEETNLLLAGNTALNHLFSFLRRPAKSARGRQAIGSLKSGLRSPKSGRTGGQTLAISFGLSQPGFLGATFSGHFGERLSFSFFLTKRTLAWPSSWSRGNQKKGHRHLLGPARPAGLIAAVPSIIALFFAYPFSRLPYPESHPTRSRFL